jgi:hypothetical protein
MKVQQKTKAEQLQDIINDYLEAHGGGEIDMKDVAAWAIREKRWVMPKRDAIKQCAQELSEAARQEHFVDEEGRTVRRKHAIRLKDDDGKPRFLWADIGDAKPEHMRLSLSQRRQGILGDCKQLKNDIDHYNQHNTHGAELFFGFDFSEDLAELEQPTEYPDEPADEDDPTSFSTEPPQPA